MRKCDEPTDKQTYGHFNFFYFTSVLHQQKCFSYDNQLETSPCPQIYFSFSWETAFFKFSLNTILGTNFKHHDILILALNIYLEIPGWHHAWHPSVTQGDMQGCCIMTSLDDIMAEIPGKFTLTSLADMMVDVVILLWDARLYQRLYVLMISLPC